MLESREEHTCELPGSRSGRGKIPHLVAGNYAIAYTEVARKPSDFQKCNITFVNCFLFPLCDAIDYIAGLVAIGIFT